VRLIFVAMLAASCNFRLVGVLDSPDDAGSSDDGGGATDLAAHPSDGGIVADLAPPVLTSLALLAGDTPGYQDGTGAKAQFDNPNGLAVDAAGNLYVADTSNDVIRKIDVNAVVTTIAGHPGDASDVAERGAAPLLVQPEGIAVDASGFVYVADRERGVVLKLDPGRKVVDPSYLAVRRPRALAMDPAGPLWVASDADADAPWQRGKGEIRRMTGKDSVEVVLRGLVAAGIAVSPEGNLFVADRHAGKVLFVSPDGVTGELASFTTGDAPRGLAFAPVTPETRAAGIAGELFIVTIRRAAWSVNEIVRVSGPFDDAVRAASSRP